jgi:CheY-like chemotaxis protein
MLAITDGGSGMDATTQARIFEPFFTTKEPGKGTGLGLSTVYGVVKQSGGYIWVYSELGRGTTFKIYLPRVEDELEARALGPAPAETLQGSETILLAEDEDMVRALARRILQAHGYTVLEARDGTECLRICQAHTGPIHLLMTDVVMPGLSGRAVADRVAPLRPDMKVLYLSGYADNAVVHHGLLDAGRAFLQKPFSAGTLAHKVREVLDAPPKK